ncbi:hypothetical protein AA313_de0205619 [Arthrobotrys entomopaga]|nr:hypothetical protein AA313_de0205619 [Arthrobotrys entomopaga]
MVVVHLVVLLVFRIGYCYIWNTACSISFKSASECVNNLLFKLPHQPQAVFEICICHFVLPRNLNSANMMIRFNVTINLELIRHFAESDSPIDGLCIESKTI